MPVEKAKADLGFSWLMLAFRRGIGVRKIHKSKSGAAGEAIECKSHAASSKQTGRSLEHNMNNVKDSDTA